MNNRPLDVLGKAIDKKILVKLKGFSKISGTLKAFDLHLNLWLSDAIEYNNDTEIKLGETLVRGDSIILISAD